MECNCEYNCGVICSAKARRCERCGWNPQEDKRRLKMIRNGEMSDLWNVKKLRIKKIAE